MANIDEEQQVVGKVDFDFLAGVVHKIAVDKCFWMPEGEDDDVRPTMDKLAAKIALIHSECSELLEALRKSKSEEKIVEEIVDILIRTLDFYGALYAFEFVDVKLQATFDKKVDSNRRRPPMHGHRWG